MTTNTSNATPPLPMDAAGIDRMVSALVTSQDPTLLQPCKGIMRQAYFDAIVARSPMVKDPTVHPPQGALATLNGIPIAIDDLLPDGVQARFINKRGQIVSEIRTQPPTPGGASSK